MKIVLLLAGFFILVFLATGIIGYLLRNPRTMEMTAILPTPIELVWQIVTDPENQENWRSDITKVKTEELQDKVMVWTE